MMIRTRPTKSLAAAVALVFSLFSAPTNAAERWGAIRGVIVNQKGVPLLGLDVELFGELHTPTKHRRSSLADGAFNITDVEPGDYTLRIMASGLLMKSIKITVVAGRETLLGAIPVQTLDCGRPGIICDDFSYLRGTFRLSCVDGLGVLVDSDGSPIVLDSDETDRRAVHSKSPEWPKDARSGDSVIVYLVIGVTGKVLCATVAGKHSPLTEAAIAAAQKWEFQPVLRQGLPVPVLGELKFEVRHHSPGGR